MKLENIVKGEINRRRFLKLAAAIPLFGCY